MASKMFEENLLTKLRETIYYLEEEWRQISLSDTQKAERKQALYNATCEMFDKLLEEERLRKEKLFQRIKDNKVKLLDICQELHLSFDLPEDICVVELDSYIEDKIAELLLMKEERLAEFMKLSENDQVISSYLGEPPLSVQDLIPSESDLQEIRRHIEEMEDEKRNRKEAYQNLRKDIVNFVEQLEKPLEAQILLDVVCNSEPEAHLTKSYLLDIRKLHSDLDFDVKEVESRSLELRERISSLWNLLQFPEDTKEAFLATVPSHSPSSISKLQDHLAELKELRLQNLSRFIQDLQTELEKWWSKCYVCEKEKNAFNLQHSSSDSSEEVLEAIEAEVHKWKKYYETNSHILEKVDYFLALFDNMQQLEEKLKDPTRLFNTRGGALLQEEKERKKVKLELPQVQYQLINLCSVYEAANGEPFYIDGNSIEEYLCKLWDYHDIQKEKEKNDRVLQKKPVTRPRTVTGNVKPLKVVTPRIGCRKRGREGDDNGGVTHAKKLARTPVRPACSSPFSVSPRKGLKTPNMGPPSSSKVRTLQEKNTALLPPPFRQPFFKDEATLHTSVSYDDFKATLKRLHSKEVVHSSVLETNTFDSDKENLKLKMECHNVCEREAYLKRTLNLMSPLKKVVSPLTSSKTSFHGGSSAGTFLVRSMSQPTLKRTSKSPLKISTRRYLFRLM